MGWGERRSPDDDGFLKVERLSKRGRRAPTTTMPTFFFPLFVFPNASPANAARTAAVLFAGETRAGRHAVQILLFTVLWFSICRRRCFWKDISRMPKASYLFASDARNQRRYRDVYLRGRPLLPPLPTHTPTTGIPCRLFLLLDNNRAGCVNFSPPNFRRKTGIWRIKHTIFFSFYPSKHTRRVNVKRTRHVVKECPEVARPPKIL